MEDHSFYKGGDTIEEWIKVQESLKQKLVLEDCFSWTISSPDTRSVENATEHNLKFIGGVDVSFLKDDPSMACAALVIVDAKTLDVVHEEFDVVRLQIPYFPGFLAFREAPILRDLLDKMKQSAHPFYPQLLMVDGNGLLHPRGGGLRGLEKILVVLVLNASTYAMELSLCLMLRFKFNKFFFFISLLSLLHSYFSNLTANWNLNVGFGLACHLGVLVDLPTIGVGKNLHHVDGLTQSGVKKFLEAKENCDKDLICLVGRSGQVWGAAMRSTHCSTKPIYVSTGHRICLDSSIKVVKMCCKFRVPEPIRQADIRSRVFIQKLKGSSPMHK